jgi:hypothetical protein
MAKYWDNLKYHEDTIEKRPITREDVQFLMELQKEMNTQDTLSQADPRYWVIRDYSKVYGENLNTPEGCEIFIDDNKISTMEYTTVGDTQTIEEVKKYFLEEHDTEFEESDFDDLYDLDDLEEMLRDRGYEISVVEYEIIPKHSGMFLTQKAAEEHLRANYYHYDDNATTFCMTAWRSTEADKLYEILHRVDFSKIKLEENSCTDVTCPYYEETKECPAREGCAGYERSDDN